MNEFYALPFAQRLYLERCALSIVYDHYYGDTYALSFFMTKARWHAITKPVVKALVWRIEQELDSDE